MFCGAGGLFYTFKKLKPSGRGKVYFACTLVACHKGGQSTWPALAGKLNITALVASRLEYVMVTWTSATLNLLHLSLHSTAPSKKKTNQNKTKIQ